MDLQDGFQEVSYQSIQSILQLSYQSKSDSGSQGSMIHGALKDNQFHVGKVMSASKQCMGK